MLRAASRAHLPLDLVLGGGDLFWSPAQRGGTFLPARRAALPVRCTPARGRCVRLCRPPLPNPLLVLYLFIQVLDLAPQLGDLDRLRSDALAERLLLRGQEVDALVRLLEVHLAQRPDQTPRRASWPGRR